MKVLFVVAHPHYPACYTAGTVANHVKQGDEVYVASMTYGEKVSDLYPEAEIVKINEREMAEASKVLGIKEVRYLGAEDTCVQVTEELREKLTDTIREIKPDIIITHWKEDTHPDVRATVELTEDCVFFAMLKQGKWARNFTNHITPAVYAFDMPGYSKNFVPDVYVDITDQIEAKREATKCLQIHLQSEAGGDVDRWLYPMLTANARWAMETQPDCKYAEVYKRIWIHEAVHKAVSVLPVE